MSLSRPVSRDADGELGWLSYLSDHVTFKEVAQRYGHLGVDECCRRFRQLYRGNTSYTDREVRHRFELQQGVDQQPQHKQTGDIQQEESKQADQPDERSCFDHQIDGDKDEKQPMPGGAAAVRLASPSPLRRRLPASTSSPTRATSTSTSPSTEACSAATVTPGGPCADSEALQDGDRQLVNLMLRHSWEVSELDRSRPDDGDKLAMATAEQQDRTDEDDTEGRVPCCRRLCSLLAALIVLLLMAVLVGAGVCIVWCVVEELADDSVVDAVQHFANEQWRIISHLVNSLYMDMLGLLKSLDEAFQGVW